MSDYTTAHLDDLGDGPGIRKVRKPLGVTAFGVNALIIPSGYTSPKHAHERQEELYFVHRGEVEFLLGDDETTERLGPGGIARVAADTTRSLRSVGDEDAVIFVVGGEGGYVGRDGIFRGETD